MKNKRKIQVSQQPLLNEPDMKKTYKNIKNINRNIYNL